jgi:gentisate 1,2-dioxygenase
MSLSFHIIRVIVPFSPFFTFLSNTAAWQLLLPGERALCHRHTIFAIRFLIEGEGAYTAVGGKKMYMSKGDLILTSQCG